jgi:hypothetical protein
MFLEVFFGKAEYNPGPASADLFVTEFKNQSI